MVRSEGENWKVQFLTEERRAPLIITIYGERFGFPKSEAEALAAAIEESIYAH